MPMLMMLLMLVICKQRMLPIFMHEDAADAFNFDGANQLLMVACSGFEPLCAHCTGCFADADADDAF